MHSHWTVLATLGFFTKVPSPQPCLRHLRQTVTTQTSSLPRLCHRSRHRSCLSEPRRFLDRQRKQLQARLPLKPRVGALPIRLNTATSVAKALAVSYPTTHRSTTSTSTRLSYVPRQNCRSPKPSHDSPSAPLPPFSQTGFVAALGASPRIGFARTPLETSILNRASGSATEVTASTLH